MKLFRSILSLVLALLVLVSSTSFMVGIHVCGGHVQDVALFTKAGSCESKQTLPPCEMHMKPGCCQDESIIHNGEGFKASVVYFHLIVPTVEVAEPVVILSEIIPSSPFSKTEYYNYDPPLRSSDLTIALQVFLI